VASVENIRKSNWISPVGGGESREALNVPRMCKKRQSNRIWWSTGNGSLSLKPR